jgi:hypothetical protein
MNDVQGYQFGYGGPNPSDPYGLSSQSIWQQYPQQFQQQFGSNPFATPGSGLYPGYSPQQSYGQNLYGSMGGAGYGTGGMAQGTMSPNPPVHPAGPTGVGQQPQQPPTMYGPGQGSTGLPGQGSGIQGAPTNVSQQQFDRNQTVGQGGKAGIATLLQEQGINPYASGNPYAQDLMNNADALTLQSKIQSLMNPGMSADQSMGGVVGNVLGNKGVYFDPQTASQVYQSLSGLGRQYATNQDVSGPAQMAYETFFGNNSAPNVSQLLYGTQTGALGQALQSSVLQQAAQGQYRYQHPDQFQGMPDPQQFMGWLDAYNRSSPR